MIHPRYRIETVEHSHSPLARAKLPETLWRTPTLQRCRLWRSVHSLGFTDCDYYIQSVGWHVTLYTLLKQRIGIIAIKAVFGFILILKIYPATIIIINICVIWWPIKNESRRILITHLMTYVK